MPFAFYFHLDLLHSLGFSFTQSLLLIMLCLGFNCFFSEPSLVSLSKHMPIVPDLLALSIMVPVLTSALTLYNATNYSSPSKS